MYNFRLKSLAENLSLMYQLEEELTTPKESYSIIRGDKIRDDSFTGKRNVQVFEIIFNFF